MAATHQRRQSMPRIADDTVVVDPPRTDGNVWASTSPYGGLLHKQHADGRTALCGESLTSTRWHTYHVDPAAGPLATPSIGTPCTACVATALVVSCVSRTSSADLSATARLIDKLDAHAASPDPNEHWQRLERGDECAVIRSWALGREGVEIDETDTRLIVRIGFVSVLHVTKLIGGVE